MRVNVSIGVAVFPDASSELTDLMRLADLAMYEAKSAGGNAVCFHGSPLLCSPAVADRREAGARHAPS